ncbi:MAG: hypothetical protein ACRDHU_15015 [Actinomycetota bacterium]
MSDRGDEPKPEPETQAEDADLDTAHEPEPEWAEGIRRGRRERAERLRELLDTPEGEELAP